MHPGLEVKGLNEAQRGDEDIYDDFKLKKKLLVSCLIQNISL